ncbi:hypothetical protein O9G_004059 [Rozella allomycis CSF55]|uniref:Uncharacterized protein n=1 Tax=Rozella allomycis (strain CSF55) TaxID=988480 RepID=A0A075AZR6_ROZAC|nr:hypothetical protein O9G_004059 [Rozella allomycis CSF55]|eukprot:EPZ34182.1 hypothetical protein O9G_004059 [Rozella allomycis CSF55]
MNDNIHAKEAIYAEYFKNANELIPKIISEEYRHLINYVNDYLVTHSALMIPFHQGDVALPPALEDELLKLYTAYHTRVYQTIHLVSNKNDISKIIEDSKVSKKMMTVLLNAMSALFKEMETALSEQLDMLIDVINNFGTVDSRMNHFSGFQCLNFVVKFEALIPKTLNREIRKELLKNLRSKLAERDVQAALMAKTMFTAFKDLLNETKRKITSEESLPCDYQILSAQHVFHSYAIVSLAKLVDTFMKSKKDQIDYFTYNQILKNYFDNIENDLAPALEELDKKIPKMFFPFKQIISSQYLSFKFGLLETAHQLAYHSQSSPVLKSKIAETISKKMSQFTHLHLQLKNHPVKITDAHDEVLESILFQYIQDFNKGPRSFKQRHSLPETLSAILVDLGKPIENEN